METEKQNGKRPQHLGELADAGAHNSKRHPYMRNGYLGSEEIQQIRKDKGYKLSFEK